MKDGGWNSADGIEINDTFYDVKFGPGRWDSVKFWRVVDVQSCFLG